jgi:hypothetical protein
MVAGPIGVKGNRKGTSFDHRKLSGTGHNRAPVVRALSAWVWKRWALNLDSRYCTTKVSFVVCVNVVEPEVKFPVTVTL